MNESRVPLILLALGIALVGSASAAPKPKAPATPPPPKPVAELEPWISLCSLRPSSELQSKLLARPVEPGTPPWHVLKIEQGYGPLLLDQNAMVITKAPLTAGVPMDAHSLLNQIRKGFPEFLQAASLSFAPLGDEDRALWQSDAPIGAISTVQVPNLGKVAFALIDAAPDSFTLSLVQAGANGFAAPAVTWQRRFTIQEATPFPGYILFSRAVGRATASAVTADQAQAGFAAPVWNAILTGAAKFVQNNTGQVESLMLPPSLGAASWESVREKFHQPKVAWLDLEGIWQSTDPGHRFRIEVENWSGKCEFIERNTKGEELRATLPLRVEQDGPNSLKYVISRPNDTKEVLAFYSFPELVSQEILAQQPQPSTFVISRAGRKLTGMWSGLAITKDTSGKHLKKITQPAEGKPKPYPLVALQPGEEATPPTLPKAKPSTAPPAAP